MWLKTGCAPHTEVVDQTLPPSPEVIARFKAALPGVHKRVLADALRIVRRKRWSREGTLPDGQEAQDLVQEAIRRFFQGKRRWEPDKVPDLGVFLSGVVSSLASQLAKSPANRTDDLDKVNEDKKTHRVPQSLQQEAHPESQLIEAESYQAVVDEVMTAACEDGVLEKITQAVMDDGCQKPEEIAQTTGLAVTEVYAGLRKLRRRLASAAKRRKS